MADAGQRDANSVQRCISVGASFREQGVNPRELKNASAVVVSTYT